MESPTTQFLTADSAADRKRLYPIIKELRPHLSLAEFLAISEEAAQRDDYEMVGVFVDDRCVAAMGYRTLSDFVHGKHLYIDDLVVTEAARSGGLGAKLLAHAERVAIARECRTLRLCTGIENEAGKRFYDREGWTLRAVAFKKPVASVSGA